MIPNPEDWATPRHNYANTNMLAQLPAAVPNDGHTDLLLQIHVGLDLAAERIAAAELRLLLSDPGAADLPTRTNACHRCKWRPSVIPKGNSSISRRRKGWNEPCRYG